MGEPLIQTLVSLHSFMEAALSKSLNRIKSVILPAGVSEPVPTQPSPLNMEILNCRVKLAEQKVENRTCEVFVVEICGSIHSTGSSQYASLKISIDDITDGAGGAGPVHGKIRQWQAQDSPAFCYSADLGRLPQQCTILPDWTAVARINTDWLAFPRRGKRDLSFHIQVLSRDSGEALACAECNFTYENTSPGYIDLQENMQRTKALAIPVAFAVSAADCRMHRSEVELIKSWAKSHIDLSEASEEAKCELENELDKTVAFFREGNQVDVCRICKDIAEIAPLAQRYDILELCLYVAQADGSASPEELDILKDLAGWLQVEPDKFRSMMEKILPVSMHQVRDTEVILGVTSDMGREKSRQQLNKEYAKWNARVTNTDPQVRTQADQMLGLIAEARSQYVG